MTAPATGREVWSGLATGIGSWPGTDPREAAAVVVGELTDMPHLVELPARGLGADMIGRVSALLVDMYLDTSTTGYRLVSRRGGVAARARDLLAQDLDALEEAWERAGPAADRPVKVQAAGPLTLAAHVELATGRRVLTDRGAVRDLAESLAEGMARHAAEITRRLGVRVVAQLDEPSLPDVLAGTLKGRTVLETVPAVPDPEALDVLDTTIRGTGLSVAVHCCAGTFPADFLRRSAADAVAFDVGRVRRSDLDGLGELFDSGTVPILGIVPATASASTGWREYAAPAVELIDRLGFPRKVLQSVAVSPVCGLATASTEGARAALRSLRDVASAFAEEADTL
ncbi:methionine synthase [Rhodococcus rhodochrous]|uniref:methionine synthase n=1 Tax=Rhodococcus rhodochrous TaxID=1829 RepID=UPI00132EC577|nr:methionine synthase [Rhodococcus rhodochrous]QHG82949.1 methionine synthase [Rhodococcus rhodochrous]QOH57368.1 methionine synthase [Rhodococcus rhodochrous]